jgi:hypothetical protein
MLPLSRLHCALSVSTAGWVGGMVWDGVGCGTHEEQQEGEMETHENMIYRMLCTTACPTILYAKTEFISQIYPDLSTVFYKTATSRVGANFFKMVPCWLVLADIQE